ncbi:MAG: HEPN domain-containing protein [Bacteroidales bacterium]|nr:HEPN domain-containing protein [Bacteroidales bacterium]
MVRLSLFHDCFGNFRYRFGKMIDVKKQIEYWTKGAYEDLMTADLLIREKRILHALFFCHLVIEKAIKAHVVKFSEEFAPRSHNLIYLSEKTGLEFDGETHIFWDINEIPITRPVS